MQDLTKGRTFVDSEGNPQQAASIIWVIEYQKRGLPHVHISVRMEGEEVNTAEIIDRNVSARQPRCPSHLPAPPAGALPDCCADARWQNLVVQGTMTHKCPAACKRHN